MAENKEGLISKKRVITTAVVLTAVGVVVALSRGGGEAPNTPATADPKALGNVPTESTPIPTRSSSDGTAPVDGSQLILRDGTIPAPGTIVTLWGIDFLCTNPITFNPNRNSAFELLQQDLGQSNVRIHNEPHVIVQLVGQPGMDEIATFATNLGNRKYTEMDPKSGDVVCGLAGPAR